MSRLHHDPMPDEAGVQEAGGTRTGASADANSASPGRLSYTPVNDAPALIARKVSPRFASRLKNRLNRL